MTYTKEKEKLKANDTKIDANEGTIIEPDPPPPTTIGVMIVLVLINVILVLIIGVYATCYYCCSCIGKICHRAKSTKYQPAAVQESSALATHDQLPDDGEEVSEMPPLFHSRESDLALLQESNHLIDLERLTLGHLLGKGNFGIVYTAKLDIPGQEMQIDVAVKTVNSRRDIDMQSCLMEALIMRQLDHPHVISLIGVCFASDNKPLVVVPFMPHGDVKSYLCNHENIVTLRELITMALHIASGIEYSNLSQ